MIVERYACHVKFDEKLKKFQSNENKSIKYIFQHNVIKISIFQIIFINIQTSYICSFKYNLIWHFNMHTNERKKKPNKYFMEAHKN